MIEFCLHFSDYRENYQLIYQYRYRKNQRNYQKIININKNYLSLTPYLEPAWALWTGASYPGLEEPAGHSSPPGILTPRQETVSSFFTAGVVGMKTDSPPKMNAGTHASRTESLLRTFDEVALVSEQ